MTSVSWLQCKCGWREQAWCLRGSSTSVMMTTQSMLLAAEACSKVCDGFACKWWAYQIIVWRLEWKPTPLEEVTNSLAQRWRCTAGLLQQILGTSNSYWAWRVVSTYQQASWKHACHLQCELAWNGTLYTWNAKLHADYDCQNDGPNQYGLVHGISWVAICVGNEGT